MSPKISRPLAIMILAIIASSKPTSALAQNDKCTVKMIEAFRTVYGADIGDQINQVLDKAACESKDIRAKGSSGKKSASGSYASNACSSEHHSYNRATQIQMAYSYLPSSSIPADRGILRG